MRIIFHSFQRIFIFPLPPLLQQDFVTQKMSIKINGNVVPLALKSKTPANQDIYTYKNEHTYLYHPICAVTLMKPPGKKDVYHVEVDTDQGSFAWNGVIRARSGEITFSPKGKAKRADSNSWYMLRHVPKLYHSICVEFVMDTTNKSLVVKDVEWRIPDRTLLDPGKTEFGFLVYFSQENFTEDMLRDAIEARASEFKIAIIDFQTGSDDEKDIYLDGSVRTCARKNVKKWLASIDKYCRIHTLEEVDDDDYDD